MAGEDGPQDGDILDQRDIPGGDLMGGGDEGGGGGQGLALGLLGDDLHQEEGAAGADHVDGDTGEDDVRLQVEGEKSHQQGHQNAAEQGHHETHGPGAAPVSRQGAEEGGDHHGALQTDVGNAGLLANHGAQGGEEDGGGDTQDGEEEISVEDQLQHLTSRSLLRFRPRLRPRRPSGRPAPPGRP